VAGNRWPQAKRDALPAGDFAGPHQSFPIKTAKDVNSADRLSGKAADPAAVRAKVRALPEKKGLTGGLPEKEKPPVVRTQGMARMRVGQ
jgi:hypothetical protein